MTKTTTKPQAADMRALQVELQEVADNMPPRMSDLLRRAAAALASQPTPSAVGEDALHFECIATCLDSYARDYAERKLPETARTVRTAASIVRRFAALATTTSSPINGEADLVSHGEGDDSDHALLIEAARKLEGPHEWGYRCLADGGFISDNAPFAAASSLRQYAAALAAPAPQPLDATPHPRNTGEPVCTDISAPSADGGSPSYENAATATNSDATLREKVAIPLVFYDANDPVRRVASLAAALECGHGKASIVGWRQLIADLNKALAQPQAIDAGEERKLQIGDRVFVNADNLPASYREDWRDVIAYVVGLKYADEMPGGVDVTISERWPPTYGGDYVDGFELTSLVRTPATPADALSDGGGE